MPSKVKDRSFTVEDSAVRLEARKQDWTWQKEKKLKVTCTPESLRPGMPVNSEPSAGHDRLHQLQRTM